MAGTNLRQVILKLVGPTREAATTLKAMGLAVEDVNPEFVNQIVILERLAEANITVGQATKIFSVRNAAAAVLLARNTDAIRESIKFQNEYAGAGAKLAALIEDTLAGSFRSLKSAIESVFLVMGEAGLAGGMRRITDLLTDSLRVIAGVNAELKSSERAVQIMVSAMKGLAATLAVLVGLKLVAFFASMAQAIFLAARAMLTLNFAALANPWFAVAPAIALAVGFLVAFSDELVTIGGQQTTLANLLKRSWETIGTLLEGVAATIGDQFDALFDSAIKSFRNLFQLSSILKAALRDHVTQVDKFGFLKHPTAMALFGRTALEGDFEEFERKRRELQNSFVTDVTMDGVKVLTDGIPTGAVVPTPQDDGLIKNTLLLAERDTQEELLELDKQRALRAAERVEKLKEIGVEEERVADLRKQAAEINREILLENLKLFKEGIDAQLENNKVLGDTVKLADRIGLAFADAFTEAIIGAKDLKEAIKELGLEIARLVIKQSISQPIATAISGAVDPFIQSVSGFASGLFSQTATTAASAFTRPAGGTNEDFAAGFFGLIPRMAEGGIISSKRLAILGESGPEAVIPLSKDGQRTFPGNTIINMVVNTPDANSFRRSRVQIASDLKRLTGVAR